MKKLLLLFLIASTFASAQNPLAIPPTLTGPNINLTLQDGTTQFFPPAFTNTMGANGSLLGPTLILQKDSFISITVDNQLTDTTTIHWHGMHVAPINDGGPHSVIAPGTTWNPQFTVMDKAGANWYHPHLHMQTDKHVSKGIAGMILVRDAEEASLNLPLTYGVDEFPLVLQTKGFDAAKQILVHTESDSTVMVNGTIDPVVDFPAQVVRLRVLNGSSQRLYEVGFSDNRTFSLIGTDGGLLTAPVNLTRYRMSPGQRADILVDLSSDLGQNIQLVSYASELPNAVYGATQPGMGAGATASLVGYTSNPLNGNDFQLLDINVVAQTANPILTIPSTLASYSPLLEGTENITRNLTFTSAGPMGDLTGPFLINNATFDMAVINYTIPLNNIEIWSFTNSTPIAHPFHIHDVQFFILDINGNPPPPELQGLNDVVLVPAGNGTVRFIAQFNDFADDSIPFMYHCHMLTHEDMGMMGQFIIATPTGIDNKNPNIGGLSIYPNPANELLNIETDFQIEKIILYDATGKVVLSSNQKVNTLNISALNKGLYLINIQGFETNVTQRFLKQ
ncbi:MAG: multicopper oxidase domain-containing protein [Flavobacteriales bacterium]|nr:multicopper oxidase domain-containing protein [Flavobacteriales bacterium]